MPYRGVGWFNRFTPTRLFGGTAIVVGLGMAIWPDRYDNPAYRVLFSYIPARAAGVAWVVVGAIALAGLGALSSAILATALIGWGLGLGAASLMPPPHGEQAAGSPLGWLWFVVFGLAILRTMVILGPDRMRT